MREVEENLKNHEARLDSFNPLFNAIIGELDKMNTILFSWLEENDKVYKLECDECGKMIFTPLLDGITPPEECPVCQAGIGEEE